VLSFYSGSPVLRRYEGTLEDILTYIPFGTMQVSQAEKSIELFAREVLPHLRDDSGVVAQPGGGHASAQGALR
jgi:hypothetical protein